MNWQVVAIAISICFGFFGVFFFGRRPLRRKETDRCFSFFLIFVARFFVCLFFSTSLRDPFEEPSGTRKKKNKSIKSKRKANSIKTAQQNPSKITRE